jgi:flagellar basal-body rod protein FlgF
MLADMERQDVTANNLANVDTPGFKRDIALHRAFADELAMLGLPCAGSPMGSRLARSVVDATQGDIVQTEAPLDLALDGEGFFLTEGPRGQFLTRNGRFTRSRDGELVTHAGLRVLGEKGPLKLPAGPVQVAESGNVYVGAQLVDRLRIVLPSGTSEMAKVGDSLMAAGTAPAGGKVRVRQGCYERSNVTAIAELSSMMLGLRRFEASQKALTAQDASLEQLIRAAAGR